MTKSPQNPTPFPSNDDILKFIQDAPGHVGKREIARAFRLDAEQKKILKRVLRAMENDGTLQRGRGKTFSDPGSLPAVTVIEVTGIDQDGETVGRPLNWDVETAGDIPTIHVFPERRDQPGLAVGDRVLAKLNKVGDTNYTARTIRRIGSAPASVLGIFERVDGKCRIRPADKKSKSDFAVRSGDEMKASHGDLVRAELTPGRLFGLKQARVIEVIENAGGIRSVSLIAIHEQGIPVDFNPEAVVQAEAAKAAPLSSRTDLRDVPLVTIDGADARDFDDAVWAEQDTNPKNPEGWHLIVAIADVSWYVRPGDALDLDAYERGNSVYFPDRVVPMLPEALSNGWCSLVPHEERPCVAVELWIDLNGNLLKHKFLRGLMRSAARLTYEQAQAAMDGRPDDTTGPLVEPVLTPLYGAYRALFKARGKRQALELELPERQIEMDDEGNIARIRPRERLDSHKLIEEFMITANVAAAEALQKKKRPCMYRIHDQPSPEKLLGLGDFLSSLDIKLAGGNFSRPTIFNQILKKVENTEHSHMVNQVILRSQSQAAYSPDNIGHFGLALNNYSHFTSPIRRYADLLVHRALIADLKPNDGQLISDGKDYSQIGEHISSTERRASMAERNATDRFIAGYLSDKIDSEFTGRVNGVTKFGMFVSLDETGADGLVPVRSLPNDYYRFDESTHSLTGADTGLKFVIGQKVEIRLVEANPINGGMIFEVINQEANISETRGAGRRGARKINAPRGKGKSKTRKTRSSAKATGKATGKK